MENLMTAEQSILLKEWDDKKSELVAAKEKVSQLAADELALRIRVAHSGITTQAEGTNRAAIGNGYSLKSVIKYTYKIDNEDKRTLEKQLSKLPEAVADLLIKWKPELSLTTYRALSDAHKAIADTFITTTEAAPVLDIEAPKGAKSK